MVKLYFLTHQAKGNAFNLWDWFWEGRNQHTMVTRNSMAPGLNIDEKKRRF